jgi:hypothetical protein
MTETFAPTVIVNGATVKPEGWMWILGFALGHCDWAIELCSSPEFDLRGKIADYNRRRSLYFTELEIAALELKLLEAHSTRRRLIGPDHDYQESILEVAP